MWKKSPEDSGFYWYCYIKDKVFQKVICQYEKVSKSVIFPGGGYSAPYTPLEHLSDLDGFWFGPILPPDNPTCVK
jgi:hypothetical protein